jgi:hypothetical protein
LSAFTFGAIGQGYFFDSSGSLYFPFIASLASSTTFSLQSTQGSSGDDEPRLGATGNGMFTAVIATGDVITATVMYQSSTD